MYRLNFKGFYDKLFADNLTEDISFDFDYIDVDNFLEGCLINLKTSLNIVINRAEIADIQFVNLRGYRAAVLPTERKEYLLLLNKNRIKNKAQLINALYHELGHVYQLDRLYNEKVLVYDSAADDLSALTEENKELLKKHLNVNNGHTYYWLDYADKVNNIIKPEIAITAYIEKEEQLIREELYEPNYFGLDFKGFYD